MPDGATVNVVREDPKRKGLLFAGSETQVYVSFDDGDHWQSLRLNMPATSIRDLVDQGRRPRRRHPRPRLLDSRRHHAAAAAPAPTSTADAGRLFKPQTALSRSSGTRNTDTPLPPDEPAGQNPPDGAIIDYYLEDRRDRRDHARDSRRRRHARAALRQRRISRSNCATKGEVPAYWMRPSQILSGERAFIASCGTCTTRRRQARRGAIRSRRRRTTRRRNRKDPWVAPGTYTVRLTVGGKATTEPSS